MTRGSFPLSSNRISVAAFCSKTFHKKERDERGTRTSSRESFSDWQHHHQQQHGQKKPSLILASSLSGWLLAVEVDVDMPRTTFI